MAIIWYTQPEETKENEGLNFSTLYYYDEEKTTLVRIRLELRRKPHVENNVTIDDGSTSVSKSYSLIGFSNKEYSEEELKKFTCKEGSLLDHGEQPLTSSPNVGWRTYDFNYFERFNKLLHPGHKGSKVAEKPFLPGDISEKELIELAKKAMNEFGTIKLTDSSASKGKLAEEIRNAIKEVNE